MTVYYNEIDKKAAAWLRELIKEGHIASGDVDERSIEDVLPSDLKGYTQHHFFAGIGIWSRALREAGWSDDRPVWTGSCPCQPFSAAGKRKGVADERHLWPAWNHLIQIKRPGVIFGEQVARKGGLAWLDAVQADLEGMGYTSGAVPMAAAGFGAPHIRERTYWVAYDSSARCYSQGIRSEKETRNEAWVRRPEQGRSISRVEHSESDGRIGRPNDRDGGWRECPSGQTSKIGVLGESKLFGSGWDAGASAKTQGGIALRTECDDSGSSSSIDCRVGGAHCSRSQRRNIGRDGERKFIIGPSSLGDESPRPGPTNGHWRDVDWLYCRNERWRPVEPGTFPLVNGASNRVVKLRGYGNGIVFPQAKAFIEAVMEYLK